MPIYIVGHSESGGMWNCSGRYYTDSKEAMKEIEKDRANGITYTKVFTLYPERVDVASSVPLMP